MTDDPPPQTPPFQTSGRRIRSDSTWERARDLYLSGETAESVCERLDLGLSAFKARARRDKWRREDAPDPVDTYDPDAPSPDRAAVLENAWRRAAHAVEAGLSSEALRWMRAHAMMAAFVRAETREADRRQGEEMRTLTRTARGLEAESVALLRQVQNERRERILSRARESLDRLGEEVTGVHSKKDPAPSNRAERRRAERLARQKAASGPLPP